MFIIKSNRSLDAHLCQEGQADLGARPSQEHQLDQAHPIHLVLLENLADRGGLEGRKFLVDQLVQLELVEKKKDLVRDLFLHHLELVEVVAKMGSRRVGNQEDPDYQELPKEHTLHVA